MSLDSEAADINQLQQIMRLTGTPPASLINRMPSHEVRPMPPVLTPTPPAGVQHQWSPAQFCLQADAVKPGVVFLLFSLHYQPLLSLHSLFFPFLTHRVCLSKALLVYSDELICGNTLVLNTSAQHLCNACDLDFN